MVTSYKEAMARVRDNCATIASTSLVSILKKKVYAEGEFAEAQATHRAVVVAGFESAHAEMKRVLEQTHARVFSRDSEEVQRAWRELLRTVDDRLEDSLRTAVKRSLQDVARALSGDKKTEVTPLFGAATILKNSHRVELKPDVQCVFDLIHDVCRELIGTVSAVPRLGPEEDADGEPLASFFDRISRDEDAALKQIVAIDNGITLIVEKTQVFLGYWEKTYKHVWETDKDSYIRRYAEARKPAVVLRGGYPKTQGSHRRGRGGKSDRQHAVSPRRLRPAQGDARHALRELVQKFTGLLNETAAGELDDLYRYFDDGAASLRDPPKGLDELADKVNMHRRFVGEKEETHAKFAPCKAKYALLEKFEVAVNPAELEAIGETPGCLDVVSERPLRGGGDARRVQGEFPRETHPYGGQTHRRRGGTRRGVRREVAEERRGRRRARRSTPRASFSPRRSPPTRRSASARRISSPGWKSSACRTRRSGNSRSWSARWNT